jgi:hypothetical protein
MTAAPSRLSRAMTWLVLILAAALLLLGVSWYGWSIEVHNRFWGDIADRLDGPMTFRFYLQPTMAFIAALPDGIRDARSGHQAFFWTRPDDPAVKHGRLRQSLVSLARVTLLGLSMDIIYQIRVFDRFYPVEALMMAILLAVIPYFIFRPIVERVVRWWLARSRATQQR